VCIFSRYVNHFFRIDVAPLFRDSPVIETTDEQAQDCAWLRSRERTHCHFREKKKKKKKKKKKTQNDEKKKRRSRATKVS